MKAFIEITSGSMLKTEFNEKLGRLVADRELNQQVPANYGFVPDTLAEDGDPLDVFVLGRPLQGMVQLDVRPIGVFVCHDNGVEDNKVVAVPINGDPHDYDIEIDVTKIARYLRTYKANFEVFDYDTTPLAITMALNGSYKAPREASRLWKLVLIHAASLAVIGCSLYALWKLFN